MRIATGVLALMTMTSSAAAETPVFHTWAKTPPMGWNSWDCFGTAVTEQQTRENADYMAEKLARFGWQYIVVDIQWYEPSSSGHVYREGAPLTMDEYGRLLPAPNRFPTAASGNGFKPLADYVHSKGLEFGIHLMRGIPRQAVKQNTTILGTAFKASDIANTSDTCPWNPDMFGVDMSRPGAQEYYDSVFALIASWEVDFVKVDDLSRPYNDHKPEIEAIRRAIDKTGRAIVLSTSPGETPIDAAEHVAAHANMWRISDDFWDDWKALLEQFERCNKWSKFTGPGHWPDADMLPFGAVRQNTPSGWTKFSQNEQITCMTLWAISRSPLMMGGHLPKNDEFTLSLLTNQRVLEVNQQSTNGRQLFRRDGWVAWVADAPDGRSKYLAVFNIADRSGASQETTAEATVKLADIPLQSPARAVDLWSGQDLGDLDAQVTVRVPYHGARLLRLTPQAR